MRRSFVIIIVCLFALFACKTTSEQQTDKSQPNSISAELAQSTEPKYYQLEILWETKPKLAFPEEVVFSRDGQFFYTSLVAGHPLQQDGVGYIAKVGLDGSIQDTAFVSGLDAPKGMRRYENLLYLAEPTEIVIVDIDRAAIIRRVPVADARLLHNIAIDEMGTVYVSDMFTGKIHLYKNGELSTYVEGLTAPAGMVLEGKDIYVITGEGLIKVDANQQMTTISSGMDGRANGLIQINSHEFISTHWGGHIYSIHKNGTNCLLLDTEAKGIAGGINTYDPKTGIMYMTTDGYNTVRAFKIKEISAAEAKKVDAKKDTDNNDAEANNPPPRRNGAGFQVLGTRPPEVAPVEGQPLETRAPMGENQKSAFAGQTRAKAMLTKTPYQTAVVTENLFHPWSITFMPDGRMLITEKNGALRIVTSEGNISEAVSGMPEVVYQGDAGLLDLAIDPNFSSNRSFYFAFVEPRGAANALSIASARLSNDETQIENLRVIYRVAHESPIPAHYGARLLFDKMGKLFVSTSERFMDDVRIRAQWLSSDLGKILRINTDGLPATDNPTFPDSSNARKEIWAYGIRSPQGLAFHPETGELWESEHGPQGGDEINIIQAGKNYGWPVIAYGTEYTGDLINDGKSAQEGMEQPVYYWDPAIAPSGICFYSGKQIPEWKNNLFVTALAGQHLSRLVLEGNRVIGEERLLLDQQQRIRDIAEAPDGALWVVTDEDKGRLIKIFN